MEEISNNLKQSTEKKIAKTVRNEIEKEKFEDTAWIKAYKKAKGNANQAKVYYVDIRVADLKRFEEKKIIKQIQLKKRKILDNLKKIKKTRFIDEIHDKINVMPQQKQLFKEEIEQQHNKVMLLSAEQEKKLNLYYSHDDLKIYLNVKKTFLDLEDKFYGYNKPTPPIENEKQFDKAREILNNYAWELSLVEKIGTKLSATEFDALKKIEKYDAILESLDINEIDLDESNETETEDTQTSSRKVIKETISDNLSSKLKKLTKLYKDGTLTKAEFEKAKDKLLK